MKATVRHLLGRTIVAVDMRPFPDGQGGTAHSPVLTLDNGRRVFFVTEEIDSGGAYGTCICITEKSHGDPER
jgi:hypothetical protein